MSNLRKLFTQAGKVHISTKPRETAKAAKAVSTFDKLFEQPEQIVITEPVKVRRYTSEANS